MVFYGIFRCGTGWLAADDDMEFLHYPMVVEETNFEKNVPGNGKRRKSTGYGNGAEDFSGPVRQRSQANARERDRTHRYSYFSLVKDVHLIAEKTIFSRVTPQPSAETSVFFFCNIAKTVRRVFGLSLRVITFFN